MQKLYTSMIYITLVIFLFGCGLSENPDHNSQEETITITHEFDEVKVAKNPKRIVVFDFGVLDILDELGIEVTGVPKGNIPDYLDQYADNTYENVGSLKEPDFEKIAEIDPDLIIISGRQATLYDELSKLGSTVYIDLDTENYIDSFKENLKIIGEIFEKETELEERWEEIEDSIENVKNEATDKNKNALIILANDDKISAYGSKSRFGLIHDVLGVKTVDENIEASNHGQNVGFEYVVEKDPDILYVIDRGAAVGGESSAHIIVENQLVEQTKAYQNDDIYYLNPDYWYLSNGGLTSVTEMIREIEESLN